MEQLSNDVLTNMSISELEEHLDKAQDVLPKAYLISVMKIRNEVIEVEEAAQWGLTPEQYAEAKHKSEEANRIENELTTAQCHLKKLTAGVASPETTAMIAETQQKIDKLTNDHKEAQGRKIPLHALLSKARSAAIKQRVQTAKAGVAVATPTVV